MTRPRAPRRGRRRLGLLSAAAGLMAIAGIAASQPAAPYFADADDSAAVAAGQPLYMRYCATCHGRRLQGQPLWQTQDQYARRRAPAHDESGHTWQHSDEEIFHMTKFGRFSTTPPDAASSMPAFAGVLGDADILSVIAFIKARWPLGLRASQAMLNPGFAGMPAGANEVDWTLPPNCSATVQRWWTQSR